jgi:hypothetical protein
MKLLHHVVVAGMLSLGFTAQVHAFPGVHDFDFSIGRWQVHHRRLNERSIWWLDSRSPQGPLDPPVIGGFKDGAGTLPDNALNGKPIRVRFVWSRITRNSCQREQAFSDDQGATWETSWEMDLIPEP